ncbi:MULTISPECIES: hypothetical protein [Bacillus cereus group]|nr:MULTISPECIES: hypothetical protein [Bacillus cereus group]MEC5241177.1 hypothetical protein [Bacillus mycoides]
MKKILAIIPVLAVLGGFLLNSATDVKEQKQEAKAPIVMYSNDPGGW